MNATPPAARSDLRSAIERMLDPHSIAVVGASSDPAKRGHRALAQLVDLGFPYPLHPVNPSGGTLLGLAVSPSLTEIGYGVDLALVATPARTVPAVLADAAGAGVGGVVVLAVGFAESGDDGRELQAEIARIAKESGLRVIGPNTSGLFNTHAAINLVGVPDAPPGPVGVLTQSGNMLLSLLEDSRSVGGPGFSTFVGVGNQVDVGFEDLLPALADDSWTKAIAMHSEGFRDGRALLAQLYRVSAGTPVVLLKGGTSDAGRRAALSHTAALAGSGVVARQLLTQAGAEVVERSDELAVVSAVLAGAPTAAGSRVAVLADGGGHATLCADALSRVGLELAELSPDTRRQLAELYGPAAAVTNPVDVAGATDEDPALFSQGAGLLLADDGVDLLVIVGLIGGYQVRFGSHLAELEGAAARALADTAAAGGKPVLVQSSYAAHHTEPQKILNRAGLPVTQSIEHAVRAAAAVARRGDLVRSHPRRSAFPPLALPGASTPTRTLTEPEARTLLADLAPGLPMSRWRLAASSEELESAVREMGGRCALKVVSPQVIHKSDVGGVELEVTATGAAEAGARILTSVCRHLPDAEVEGILVAPMAPAGSEWIIGGSHDPVFGPVIAFGPGGTLVELLDSTGFRAVPLTSVEADELIAQAAPSRLLEGFRGAPPVDRGALRQALVGVSELLATHPEIAELDLNPVIVSGEQLVVADARIVVHLETA